MAEQSTRIREGAKDRYRQAVVGAADGEELGDAELVGALAAAGKTVAEFEAAVGTLVARREALTMLEQAAKLAPEVRATRDEWCRAVNAVEGVRLRHAGELKEAQRLAGEAATAMRRCETRRDRLVREAHDALGPLANPAVASAGGRRRCVELQCERQELQNTLVELQRERARLQPPEGQPRLKPPAGNANISVNPDAPRTDRSALDRYTRAVADITARMQQCNARLADVDREIHDLHQPALDDLLAGLL